MVPNPTDSAEEPLLVLNSIKARSLSKISRLVSIVPLLLAVVAGLKEEQRATHENRLPFPPAVAHSLNEAVQKKRMSQSVLFLDSSRRSASTAHFPSGRLHP
jgi:hypothetical protein